MSERRPAHLCDLLHLLQLCGGCPTAEQSCLLLPATSDFLAVYETPQGHTETRHMTSFGLLTSTSPASSNASACATSPGCTCSRRWHIPLIQNVTVAG